MNFLSLIEAKRDGKSLTPADIKGIVNACVDEQVPDYQMAAFLMAVYFRGLNRAETTELTLAMRDSGDRLQFPSDSKRPLVDKHSTGGVGDKVSLPLAPLLACLGFRVPMISGRGLGITGGTLDKLDSIPGFKTSLSIERIVEIVDQVGCVVCGQTERMVPADKRLYALRDVTGTVPSIPLIVASILSKKLAESLEALVLDVKFGSAAFMSTQEEARKLAREMVTLGKECGVHTRALLTNMDTPLGASAGNWLEVKESVACLDPHSSREKAGSQDLRQLVLHCAAHLLVQTGRCRSIELALDQADKCLASGEPRQRWDDMLAAQGADLEAFKKHLAREHTAKIVLDVPAPRAGIVARCDARLVGEIVRDLGGGRLHKDSQIDHAVGVEIFFKPGEPVSAKSILARVHASDRTQAEKAVTRLIAAFAISESPPEIPKLIAEVVE